MPDDLGTSRRDARHAQRDSKDQTTKQERHGTLVTRPQGGGFADDRQLAVLRLGVKVDRSIARP